MDAKEAEAKLTGLKANPAFHDKTKPLKIEKLTDIKYQIRYVIFSESAGVFLGEKVWSYDKKRARKHNSAISYNITDVETAMKFFREKEGRLDVKAYEVFPDLIYNLCSNDAIANAGLPRWEFDEKKLPILPKFRLANLVQREEPETEEEDDSED